MTYLGDRILTQPADGMHLDAFARLRVSNAHILLASALLDHAQPMLWATEVSAGGTVGALDTDRASITLSTDGTADEYAIRQTRRYYQYKPGQSQLIVMTGVMGAADEVAITLRSSVSGSADDSRRILQSDWNIDGLGHADNPRNPSGKTLDPTKSAILAIDLQWLGVGRCRVGFDLDGVFVPVHEFLNAGVLDSVYMSTARLPVRYEVRNDGTDTYRRMGYFDGENGIYLETKQTGLSAVSLETICAAVVREGGDEDQGSPNAAGTPITGKVQIQDTTLRSLVAIRLKSANLRAEIQSLRAKIVGEDSETVRWYALLVREADLPGGFSWTDAGSATFPSVVEYSTDTVDMLGVLGSARELAGGILPSGGGGTEVLVETGVDVANLLTSDVSGARDVIVMCAQSAAANNDCWGHLAWQELT